MEGLISRLRWSVMGNIVHVNRGGAFMYRDVGEAFGHVGSREGKLGIPYGALIRRVFITLGTCGGMGMGVDRGYPQDGKDACDWG